MEPGLGRIGAFFDVDRTVVRGSSMLALAGPLRRAGVISRRDVVHAAVRGLQFSARGFSEVEVQRAVRSMGDAVRGLDAAELRRVANRAIPRVLGPRVYDEALRLMTWHRGRGHLVFLVSASTHDLIDKLGEIVEADGVVASEAEIVSGRYTGTVALCHGSAKLEAVRRLAAAHGVDLGRSYAYGDGSGDIPMLRAVGHPTAVNPDRRLRAAAERYGWRQLRFRSRDRLPWRAGNWRLWQAATRQSSQAATLQSWQAATRRPAPSALGAAPPLPDPIDPVVAAEAPSDSAV